MSDSRASALEVKACRETSPQGRMRSSRVALGPRPAAPLPKSALGDVIVLIAYESFSSVNRRPLRVDFSTRQIPDSTALSKRHFFKHFRLLGIRNFSILFVPLGVISLTFAVNRWTTCPAMPAGTPAVEQRLISLKRFEHSVR